MSASFVDPFLWRGWVRLGAPAGAAILDSDDTKEPLLPLSGNARQQQAESFNKDATPFVEQSPGANPDLRRCRHVVSPAACSRDDGRNPLRAA